MFQMTVSWFGEPSPRHQVDDVLVRLWELERRPTS